MFPQPNLKKFNIESFQKLREKYLPKRYFFVAIAVLLVCLITVSIFVISRYHHSKQQNNISQLTLTDPKPAPMPTAIDPNFLNQVNECFIPTAAVYGYTLRISSGFRTVAEQDQIYNQGRTVNGHIVTEAPGGKSIHNFGFAVDVVDRWREYNIDWEKLAKIGVYCGLAPSDEGDISHFEYRGGLTTDDFIAGKRPAPLTLPCPIMDERAKAGEPLTLKDLQNCGAPDFSTKSGVK